MRSLLSSMPSHPATHSTPAVSCLQHTTHGWPPPSHLSCTWEGRGRRGGRGREGGRRGGRGREVEGEGRKKGWEREGGREREERDGWRGSKGARGCACRPKHKKDMWLVGYTHSRIHHHKL